MGRRKKSLDAPPSEVIPLVVVDKEPVPTGPVVRYSIGVQIKADPKQVTYACVDKSDWTRKIVAVKWWPSEKDARDACIAMMERVKKQYWYESAEWVVEDEETVKKRLSELVETA